MNITWWSLDCLLENKTHLSSVCLGNAVRESIPAWEDKRFCCRDLVPPCIIHLHNEAESYLLVPLLESRPKYHMRYVTAKETSGNQKVIYFPRVVKVADIVSILRSNKHNGFPVIDHTRSGETLVIGLILRSHLLVLLQSKVDFQHSPLCSDVRGGSLPIRHNLCEFVKPVSSKGICINDIHLTQDDLEMYIDLSPFVNPSPYIVPEDMSLTKVYNLFRQLGLRHIFVVPHASRVVGMITRKDLLLEDNDDSAVVELQSNSRFAR